jgi:hypothetical protein
MNVASCALMVQIQYQRDARISGHSHNYSGFVSGSTMPSPKNHPLRGIPNGC